MSRFTIILSTVIGTLVSMAVLGAITSHLGFGPYWAEYHSASGIEYACMFQSKEEFVLVTLDNNGDYDEQENNQR